MSKGECKQRFKGMENFLRKVAFNLGNTPSQTEVKVISCIPIDVTDLQQKIIQLEKQLEAVCINSKPSRKETSVVCTGVHSPPGHKKSNAAVSCKLNSCRQSADSLQNVICGSSKQIKSNVSLYPARPNEAQDCYFSTDVSEITYTKKRKPCEYRKNFFNKRKFAKKKNTKTRLIYYAKTEDMTPFNNYGPADDGTSRGNEQNNSFDQSYLTDIVRKQYLPELNEDTDASEFSTPICRDVTHIQNVPKPQPYESDMCSCCHGEFRNIDHHMKQHNQFDIFSTHTDSKNSYYDSNLYDVVPVKENTVKDKNIEVAKRKELKKQMNTCLQGNMRPIYKVPPMTVNYATITPTKQHIIRKKPVKPNRTEQLLNKMAKKPIPLHRQIIHINKSKTRSVEVGEVYAKQRERRRKISKPTHAKVTNRHDAACLTTVIVDTECQTASDTNGNSQENKTQEITNVSLPEDKTKVTLNQIKDILQSVLTEVKTNNKLGISGQTKKKDAVVQNGPSQSHLYGGSSLLQTFTYSPQDVDPYLLSCSQQMQSSNLCYTNMAPGSMKCMQHYPLLVQPGQNMCASCYRNNPQVSQLPNFKRAASTATNTEELRARNKETENLIKEIYKAMALNIELPNANNPVNKHGDTIQTIKRNSTRTEDKENKDIAKAISEIFKSTNPIDTSVSQKTDTPFESKYELNKTSLRSQSQPDRNYAQLRRKVSDYYNDVQSEATDNDETEQVSRELDSDEESDGTVVNEDNQSSDSETESETDDVVKLEEPKEKKVKKGIFSKVFKLFTSRSRNIKKNKGREEQYLDTDSADYRTVRSHHAAAQPTPKATGNKSRPIVFFSKGPRNPRHQSPETISPITPYMEQEYRRYFDEKLMFHDNHSQKSSTQGTSPRKKPAYYQKVQARSALVDHGYSARKTSTHNSPRIGSKSMKQYDRHNQNNYASGKSNLPEKASIVPGKTWLKKHKLGIHCHTIGGRK